MKRYNFKYEEKSECMCDMYLDKDGEWVMYEDIKDDRALLKEAVRLLVDIEITIIDEEALSIIRGFLDRAKERLR